MSELKQDSKAWYQSKTVIAGVVAALMGILAFFKINIPGLETALTEIIVALITVIAGIGAVWGRAVANKKIE
jgi:hypothetical protein